jgi:hypothetical protein
MCDEQSAWVSSFWMGTETLETWVALIVRLSREVTQLLELEEFWALHSASSGCGWRNGLQLWNVAANILSKKLWTRGGPPAWGLGVGLTTLHRKKCVTKYETEPRTWTDSSRDGILRMELGEVGWGDVDWIVLAQDRNGWRALVNLVLNLWVLNVSPFCSQELCPLDHRCCLLSST